VARKAGSKNSNSQSKPGQTRLLKPRNRIVPLREVENQGEMGIEPGIRGLEKALGHQFHCPDLLLRALTHRSLARQIEAHQVEAQQAENDASAEVTQSVEDNERLEFLGDAVLNLVVAEALFELHPEWNEGELTRVRAQLVSRQHMAHVAEGIGLGEYLRLSKGEERSGLRHKSTVLSDSMEAVMGALFLDGGLEPVRMFARTQIMGEAVEQLAEELRSGAALGNYKSALQELLQAERAGAPVYRVKSESGPAHRRKFVVEVQLRRQPGAASEPLARGVGSTKKRAEQDAARCALDKIAAGEANLPGAAVLESKEEEASAP
jgi:ribonuclease III